MLWQMTGGAGSYGSKNPLIPVLQHGRFLLRFGESSYAFCFPLHELSFVFPVMGVVAAVGGFSLVYVEVYDKCRSVFFDVRVVAGIVMAGNAAHAARFNAYLAVKGVAARPHKVHRALLEVRYFYGHFLDGRGAEDRTRSKSSQKTRAASTLHPVVV